MRVAWGQVEKIQHQYGVAALTDDGHHFLYNKDVAAGLWGLVARQAAAGEGPGKDHS